MVTPSRTRLASPAQPAQPQRRLVIHKLVLENFDMSLGTGLNKIKGKVFRIGHIGHFNDLMLMGTLAGVEMGLALANVPHRAGGVLAAMDVLKAREAAPISKVA